MADPFTFLNNPIVTVLLFFGIIGVILYWKFGSKVKDDVLDQLKKEMQYDWGRQEIRKHTVEDLDKLSKIFTKFDKKIYIGGFKFKEKIGTAESYMMMDVKDKSTQENAAEYTPEYEYMMIKFNIPRWKSLDFFPLSIISTNIFGIRSFLFVSKNDILYPNEKELHLKAEEFTQVYDIFVPLQDMGIKLKKLDEFVFKQAKEEVEGRLQNVPAKIAQLDLRHTQNLAIEEKRAEVTAKILEGQNRQARNF